MPIYEYICEDCGEELEVIQKISDQALTDCPSCSQASLKKRTSMSAFHLKGGGWYKDGYGDGNSGTTTSGSAASSTSTSTTTSTSTENTNGSDSKKVAEKASPKKETTKSSSNSTPSSKAS